LGRQSGKSWLARYVSLDYSINKCQYVMWVSPTLTSARTHWQAILDLVEKSGLPTKRISRKDKEIHFYGGGVLAIRSVIDPDNLRGATVDLLVLDEAAFYRNGKYVWYSVCQPMITASRGKVLFTTTPNGRNWVFKLFNSGNVKSNKYYKSWHMPSTESPYQDLELLMDIKETIPEIKWREEYMAEFMSDKGGVFAGLDKASVVQPLTEPINGHEYVAGIDFGHSKDATAFTVLDKHTREQVYGVRIQNVGSVKVILRLAALIRLWSPTVVHIEKNAIGESLYDMLVLSLKGFNIVDLDWHMSKAETGEEMIDGIKLKPLHVNHDMKVNMVERLAADVEYGGLKLLVVDSEYGLLQMGEMNTFERKRTQRTQSVTYGATNNAHDDTVSALYIAYKGMPKRKRFKLPTKEKKSMKSPFKGRRGKNLHARSSKVRSGHRQRTR